MSKGKKNSVDEEKSNLLMHFLISRGIPRHSYGQNSSSPIDGKRAAKKFLENLKSLEVFQNFSSPEGRKRGD